VGDASPVIGIRSVHSRRTVRTQRSATALGCGAFGGVGTTWMPAAANTVSNAALNLLSRSRSRNRKRSTRSSRCMSRLRACWVTQSPVGCAVPPTTWTGRVASSTKNST
jgi:hypothetical protein